MKHKKGEEFFVIVPLNTKKQISCIIKLFLTLDKESLESFSVIPEQILQYGVLDLIKDFVSNTLGREVGKSLRKGRQSICRMSSVLLT